MKYTKEAIKFGLQNLGVTPNELKALIESSNGYDGDDYKRWMANELIKIAEKDGVPYTQLLAKWFNIIQSITDEYADLTFKDLWKDRIGEYAYCVNTCDFGEELTDIDWFNGVDMPWNTEFIDTMLPEELAQKLHAGGVSLFMKLTGKDSKSFKGTSLYADAKAAGIQCVNDISLMLYRLCNMAMALGAEGIEDFRVGLLITADYFFKPENAGIINFFLNCFEYVGGSFVVNAMDLYNGAFTNEDYVYLNCKQRTGSVQDGIVLFKLGSDGEVTGCYRYTKGVGSEYAKLRSSAVPCNDKIFAINAEFNKLSVGAGRGCAEALGYLCTNSSMRVPVLSTVPVIGTDALAITKDNVWEVIAYYGIKASLHNASLANTIPEFITGHPEYTALAANCLPIFLFDVNSMFRSYMVKGSKVVNPFDLLESGEGYIGKSLVAEAEVNFGFEAKELMEVCYGFLKYLQDAGEVMDGKTFDVIRKEANNSDLNQTYLNALYRCKDYVSTQYRRIIGED